ncbi:HAD hydrolase-like protein [Rhodohalobacter sp. SW132]|uniref:HAD hydrolase-like protein n=1 Tax=Rhodohalobacter sp. SW132 TaxID=2293433 RepID=UPI001315A31A|nr:HAD hydrolase-like protein [Rhodohalobacter sp. SW132]
MPLNIDEFLSNPRHKRLTFDLFDTLIFRKSGGHRSIFLLFGKELYRKGLISISPERFARQRDLFETRARRNNNWQEIQFEDIYREMFLSFEFDVNTELLMNEEMRIEAEQICAIPGIPYTLDRVREQYGNVIFVSDMYLPHSFLENHIKELGIWKPGDTLYLSSEYGLQKRHGLFKVVMEKENLTPSELFHFGDSPLHDVDSAKRESIGVQHCKYALENRSEKILNDHSFQTEGYTSIMAGCSRIVRLKGNGLSNLKKTAWDTGASVTGPLVFLFAQWIIEQAEQKKIKELCFLARDAYFPYKAVKLLLEKQPDIDLNIRYVYGSRFTYNPLNINELSPDEWESLTNVSGYKYSTLHDLQAALYCEKESFLHYMKQLGFNESDWDRVLADDELEKIKNHAISDPAFNNEIVQGVKDFQKLTLEHFKDGEKESGSVALIDAGWTTNSHAPFYDFIKKSGYDKVRFFYIGLTAKKTKIPADVVDTFIFNNSVNRGINRQNVYYNRPVETLLMANHGRTRSFVKKNGSVEAVLDPPENREFIEGYFEQYEKGIMAFLEEMVPHFERSTPFHDHRSAAEELITRFWRKPTKDEAQLWSKLDWEYDPLGTKTYPLASPYRYTDAWKTFKEGKLPESYSQFWSGGAEQITPSNELFVMRKAVSARNFVNRVADKLPGTVKDVMIRPAARFLKN